MTVGSRIAEYFQTIRRQQTFYERKSCSRAGNITAISLFLTHNAVNARIHVSLDGHAATAVVVLLYCWAECRI